MKENKQFMDPKTILAIILVGVVWFGWQSYLQKKYPQLNQKKSQNIEKELVLDQPTAQKEEKLKLTTEQSPLVLEKETLIDVTDESASFQISSKGMGIKSFNINKYLDRKGRPIQIGPLEGEGLFESRWANTNAPIDFSIREVEKNKFVGVSQLNGTSVERTITFNPLQMTYENQIKVTNPGKDFSGVIIRIPEKMLETDSHSIFSPSMEKQEVVFTQSGKAERILIAVDKEIAKEDIPQASLLAIGTQYFAAAIVDKSEIIPSVRVKNDISRKVVVADLLYKQINQGQSLNLSFLAFSGPKSFDQLKKIDPELSNIVDFGFFSAIGAVLLDVLKWFHQFLGNWGLSIIFLTILVRMVLLPFNLASYKSTLKMKNIQPLMQSLKEKYKADPQTLNKEMMILMKEEKVNPLGGCLPMLLQMPLLFALYQVLGNSIELYQAPFAFWIKDLSLKDPYYVLPILMGVSFWFQQKITPMAMDPAQARVMQFLPIIFSLMMISLPSGLTLYIFISTVFGIVQQQIFMKTHSAGGNNDRYSK